MGKSFILGDFENELFNNILPFWTNIAIDKKNGGFYGGITNDLLIENEIPRTAVSCARYLWTFSKAFLLTSKEIYLEIADHAYEFLQTAFWDKVHGGLFWSVDKDKKPVLDRKHHYAQAFGIYGLSEYFKATKNNDSLYTAMNLFDLLEKYAFDPEFGGYIEGSSRDWSKLADMRLGKNDMNCQKSMNTMLHMMEAYTNLFGVWKSKNLRYQLIKIFEDFSSHIISESNNFVLFFDKDWQPLSNHISFGHDIEGSWLLCEAAEVLEDEFIKDQTQALALSLAESVLRSGIDKDGGIIHEVSQYEIVNHNKEWWPQAEAVIGFYNACQISGEEKYVDAAQKCWDFIQNKFIDRVNGGWFTRLKADGSVNRESLKAGPWEDPYHQSRLCFEMINRLSSINIA